MILITHVTSNGDWLGNYSKKMASRIIRDDNKGERTRERLRKIEVVKAKKQEGKPNQG
jgi:hypothetical protein